MLESFATIGEPSYRKFDMPSNVTLAVTGLLAVCAYYAFAWLLFGHDGNAGVLIAIL